MTNDKFFRGVRIDGNSCLVKLTADSAPLLVSPAIAIWQAFTRRSYTPWTTFFMYYVECFVPLRVHCSSLADFRHACQTALQKWISILSTHLYSANHAMFAEEPYCESWLCGTVLLMACRSVKEKGQVQVR